MPSNRMHVFTYATEELPEMMQRIEVLTTSGTQFSCISRDDGKEGWTLSYPNTSSEKVVRD